MLLRRLSRLLLGARLPKTEGTLEVRGIDRDVVIRRDEHGVPYIEAQTDDDAFYGLGFCQGQDRAFHLEMLLRLVHGTLSEVVGAEMLPVDRLSRRVGFTRIARDQLPLAEERTRAQLEAFARGVNDGVRLGLPRKPHEHVLLGSDPTRFEPSDTLAVLHFFAFALSSNWDAELTRLRILHDDGPEALAALEWGAPSLVGDRVEADLRMVRAAEAFAADAAKAVHVSGLAGASNNWALAPSRTSTGRPIVANDPHLSPALPAHWWLVHVRTPAWAMTGACMPSQPVVSCGHNERVAWGITAGHVDNTDLFLERIGPDGASVLEDGRHVPCTVHEERILVKRGADVVERVLVTPRGPVVSPVLGGDDVALSLRGTWMARRPFSAYGVFRAKSADEARRMYASYPFLSESRVFADVDGHIAWQMIGDAPVRKKASGTLPTPGWDTSLGWKEAPRPFDEMPRRVDPPEGFVASANQAPGASDVTTPGFLGADWLDGHRHARIVESLAARKDWDVASTLALQVDRTTVLWRTLREPVLDALRAERRVDLAVAVKLLETWDGVMSAGSAAASVYALLLAEMTVRITRAKAPRSWRAVLGEGFNVVLPHSHIALRRQDHVARLLREQPPGWFPRGWPAEIADALGHVVDELTRRAGSRPDGWAWGKVRPLVLVHAVGSKPPLDRIFNRGPLSVGGDASTIPQGSVDPLEPLGNPIGIPNMRAVIDVGNWEGSRWVLAGGESGNPFSPHYDDLLPLWERGEGVSIGWTPDAVLARARHTLRLKAVQSST
jgi:penicillin G amidase